MNNLIIKNGVLIDKKNGFHCEKKDILVQNGIIQKIDDVIDIPNIEVFDAKVLRL